MPQGNTYLRILDTFRIVGIFRILGIFKKVKLDIF